MSRSYKPSYKTSQPNPGGWITLLIIVVVGVRALLAGDARDHQWCQQCGWRPVLVGRFHGQRPAAHVDDCRFAGESRTFTQLVNDFNAKKSEVVQRRRDAHRHREP